MFGMVLRGLIAASIGTLLLGSSTFATSDNLWHKDQDFIVTASDSVEYPTKQYWMAGCSLTWSPVMQKDGTTLREKICVFHGNKLSMGRYVDSSNQAYYVIKISSDSVYRQIAGISGYSGRVYLRPDDDTLIVQYPGVKNATTPTLWSYTLSEGAFSPEMSNVGFSVWQYRLSSTHRKPLFGFASPSGSVQYPSMNGYGLSKNRNYVVSRLKDDSLIVANTKTNEVRSIDFVRLSGILDFAVSDDGKYATVGTAARIYYTENCGRPYDYETYKLGSNQFRYSAANACEMTYVYDNIDPAKRFGSRGAIFYFSDNNTTLSFDYPRENPKYHGKIMTEAYHPEQLDYLALGDSYSSGEGDVEEKSDGSSYYTPVTDTDGGCHLSTRSYPFLLRDAWGINDEKMESVACSGAKLNPDYFGPVENYYGQNNRLATVEDIAASRKMAIEKFVPGYIRQIEFVKKYQPGLITLTAGGNDVGFAEILSYCAAPDMLEVPLSSKRWIPAVYTCGFADAASSLNELLYDSIDTQALYTQQLIREIKTISPQTKIIIVGYPSFVASGQGVVCGFNSATLDGAELRLLNDAVGYMNEMLERVAADEGIIFADIEDSLVGGRLCEGSEYVTGLFSLSRSNLLSGRLNEAFHPNALGHEKIADTIQASNVYDQSMTAPETPSTTQPNITQQASFADDDIVLSSSTDVAIDTATQTFADGSSITTVMFSKESLLGTYTAGSDGALHAVVDMSGVTPGKHVLMLQGSTPSGEPLTLYQFVTVRATDVDADGDGIPDDTDACNFIESWFDERSGTDVCVIDRNEEEQIIIADQPNPATTVDDGLNSFVGAPTIAIDAVQNVESTETSLPLEPVSVSRQLVEGGAHSDDEVSRTAVLGEAAQVDDHRVDKQQIYSLSDTSTDNSWAWLWSIIFGSSIVGGALVHGKVKND